MCVFRSERKKKTLSVARGRKAAPGSFTPYFVTTWIFDQVQYLVRLIEHFRVCVTGQQASFRSLKRVASAGACLGSSARVRV